MAAFTNDFRTICGSRENAWLVTANAGVSIILMIAGLVCGYFNIPDDWTISWFSLSADYMSVLTHPWTILTYMVTQYSPLHLLFNIIWLLWFGRICLMVLSPRGVLKLYVAGGLAGAIFYIPASLVPGLNSAGYLCGSSASVIALMAGAAVIAPDMPLRFLFGEIRLKWLAAICILLTFAGASTTTAAGQTAHAGGLLCGLLVGWSVRKDKLTESLIPVKNGKAGHPFKKKRNHQPRPVSPQAAQNLKRVLESRPNDQERLDQLLDKIRLSGYNSLSSVEKRELNAISNRLSDRKEKSGED